VSVDLIVTSPPYFGLRDYRDGDASLAGQIGNESHPREYIDNLLDCTREWMRVLKPEGSLWINLGDSYYSGRGAATGKDAKSPARRFGVRALDRSGLGFPPKSLLGLPWRYAIRCIDDLELTLRAEVIWDKPNGLPESVTDRVRRSHEHWFHFTSQRRYYSAVDEIRQPHADASAHAMSRRQRTDKRLTAANAGMSSTANPLGALPGSVWEIAAQPLKVPDHLGVDHFAAFPMEFPRRIIRGWSPPGICIACGEGLRPQMERSDVVGHDWAQSQQFDRMGQEMPHRRTPSTLGYRSKERPAAITGYACACPEPTADTQPSVVLDPFGGTGTTALVASTLGRLGISVDRSADYCRIAQWRTTDPGERARALGLPKPQPVHSGQDSLFEEIA
jgi:DNA modification methylase